MCRRRGGERFPSLYVRICKENKEDWTSMENKKIILKKFFSSRQKNLMCWQVTVNDL